MRTLGLLGGMSWESTLPYYRLINERVRARLGGLHSAKLILYSVDFAEVEALQACGDWETAGSLLADAAGSLERAGADSIVICTNTMHKVVAAIEQRVALPILHIADATAARVTDIGIRRVGLLGTRFTMEQDFYRGHLAKGGFDVLIPHAAARGQVHDIIFDELCLGLIREESRVILRGVMRDLVARGAQGIILGCTEIGLLVGDSDTSVPTFDTTSIHAEYAADWALAGTACS
jgi:aspartate racemase